MLRRPFLPVVNEGEDYLGIERIKVGKMVEVEW